jgi:hypothetical protein
MSLTGRLVKADVLAAFKKLSAVYSESRSLMKMRETGIEIWLETLERRHVTPVELEEPVRRYLASDAQYWPKPGDLLKHAITFREETRTAGRAVGNLGKAYDAWERRGRRNEAETGYEPCPVCESVVEWNPLPIVRHDHQRHYEAGIGYSGPRTGPLANKQGRQVMAPATLI